MTAITLPRTALVDELQLASTIAERKATVPILGSVMLDIGGGQLTLTATNYDCTVISDIDADGDVWAGCVPREQLLGLARLFDGDSISITPNGNGVKLQSGRGKHILPFYDVKDFPNIPRVDTEPFTLPLSPLQQMVGQVQFTVLDHADSVKPSDIPFTGISIRCDGTQLEVMATRKVVTAICECECVVEPFALIIPRQAVAALLKLEGESVQMRVSEGQAEFTTGSRTLLTRLLVGQFPEWRKFVPSPQATVTVNCDELKTAIQRAAVTMGVDNAVGYEPMKAAFDGSELRISTRGGDRGQSDEVVTLQGEASVSLGFIANQVVDVLRKCGEQVTIELVNATSAIVFKSEGLVAIVMPLGLKW